MLKFKKIGIFSLITILILSGCLFQSEKSMVEKARDVAESVFTGGDVSTNQEYEHFSVFVPQEMEVTDVTPNNVIFLNDEQIYILFYNPYEKSDSKLYFDAAKEMESSILIESFSSGDDFGYISIQPLEEDAYELQVGIGGIKMTTHTEKSNLEEDAETMMKIVKSLIPK